MCDHRCKELEKHMVCLALCTILGRPRHQQRARQQLWQSARMCAKDYRDNCRAGLSVSYLAVTLGAVFGRRCGDPVPRHPKMFLEFSCPLGQLQPTLGRHVERRHVKFFLFPVRWGALVLGHLCLMSMAMHVGFRVVWKNVVSSPVWWGNQISSFRCVFWIAIRRRILQYSINYSRN